MSFLHIFFVMFLLTKNCLCFFSIFKKETRSNEIGVFYEKPTKFLICSCDSEDKNLFYRFMKSDVIPKESLKDDTDKIVKINEIKKIELDGYSSELFTALFILKNVNEISINCEDEIHLFWMNRRSYFIFFKYKIFYTLNLKKLCLKNYSSKILSLLFSKNKIEELKVECYKAWNVGWNNFKKKIRFSQIGKLELYDYALEILINLEVESISQLFISCSKEENLIWMHENGSKAMEGLIVARNLHLFNYASMFIIKVLQVSKIEKLYIQCSKNEHVEWIDWFVSNEIIEIIRKEKLKKMDFSNILKDKKISKRFEHKRPFLDKGIENLKQSDVEKMSKKQVEFLTKNQLRNIEGLLFNTFINKKIKFLKMEQIPFLSENQINLIKDKQIKVFDENMLNALTKEQISALDPNAIASISLIVFSKLNKKFFSSLNENQIGKLSNEQSRVMKKKMELSLIKKVLIGFGYGTALVFLFTKNVIERTLFYGPVERVYVIRRY